MSPRISKPSVQYDLHTHSDRSRGSKVPGKLLLNLARQNGLEGLGVCELDAFPDQRLREHANRLRLKLALGIEFSCAEAQIIGYGMRYSGREQQELERHFAEVRTAAKQGVERLVARINRWDPQVTLARVAAYSGQALSVETTLQYLIYERHMFPTLPIARRFLREEGLTRGLEIVSSLRASEAVDRICRAGGVAIWAHPQTTPQEQQAALLDELADAGLQGVEMVYPYRENGYQGPESNEVLQARTLSLTKRTNLLSAGGSDCKYPVSPLDGMRPVLPGEFGITAQEAEFFARAFR